MIPTGDLPPIWLAVFGVVVCVFGWAAVEVVLFWARLAADLFVELCR